MPIFNFGDEVDNFTEDSLYWNGGNEETVDVEALKHEHDSGLHNILVRGGIGLRLIFG